MKKKISISFGLSVLILLSVLVSCFGFNVYADVVPQVDLSVNSDGSIIATYYEDTKELRISGSGVIKSYNSYSDSPMYDFKIGEVETLVIEDGITELGSYSLYGIKPIEISIPSSLKTLKSFSLMGFGSDELNFIMPSTITNIDAYAFNGSRFALLSLPENLEVVGPNTFYGVVCETLTLPQSLKEIQESGFKSSSFGKINFNEGLLTIGSYAFSGARLGNISLPSSVKSIGSYAFSAIKNAGTSIVLNEGLTEMGSNAFEKSSLGSVTIPGTLKSIPAYCFYDSSVSNIVLSDGVESIGDRAFYKTQVYQSISLPTTLNHVENYAFSNSRINCTLEIPGSLERLSDYMFREARITNLKLNEGLKTIGSYCFNTSIIPSVVLPSSVETVGNDAFRYLETSTLTLNEGLKNLGDNAFANVNAYNYSTNYLPLSSIRIPSTVTEIPAGCFQGSSILEIILHDDITSIGSSAFSGCEISSFDLPESVVSVGDSILSGCSKLQEIDLTGSLESLSWGFCQESGLTSVVIPENIKNIDDRAFWHCPSLGSVTFTNGLTSIGSEAFRATPLTSVVFPDSLKTICELSFADCSNLSTIDLNEGLETIEGGAFRNTALTSLSCPSSLQIIEIEAFKDCSSLTSVEFNEGLWFIDIGAFKNTGITEVSIPSTTEHLEGTAFEGAPLKSMTDNYNGNRTVGGMVSFDTRIYNRVGQSSMHLSNDLDYVALYRNNTDLLESAELMPEPTEIVFLDDMGKEMIDFNVEIDLHISSPNITWENWSLTEYNVNNEFRVVNDETYGYVIKNSEDFIVCDSQNRNPITPVSVSDYIIDNGQYYLFTAEGDRDTGGIDIDESVLPTSKEISIILNAVPTMFKVTVPIRININMNSEGLVTTGQGYVISNECAMGPVIITHIKVNTATDWKLGNFTDDYNNMPASSKILGLQINGVNVGSNGIVEMSESLSSVIKNKESKELSFEAKLPPQKVALHENVAAIVFTVDFDKV